MKTYWRVLALINVTTCTLALSIGAVKPALITFAMLVMCVAFSLRRDRRDTPEDAA